ncbi:hypothetical protein FK216_09330 [Moraxellaceae bacterium AER2_44_116]|nr:hypothetical protein [Moraxellaceae bacterium]TQC97467.1 hypothetical protein FK216_09330 [Moraxellaceae bacterium AER2_44_116]
MTRWKASFIHLLISLAVVGSVAAYIIYFWYPLALIPMAKADKLLGLVGGIDLIVGPLLTLLVYKTGKATLKMDLTVIALIQAAFLSIGLYTMFMSRPVFIVASSRGFDLVFAPDIAAQRLAQAQIPQYKTLSITKPKLVGVKMPTDPNEQMRIINSALAGLGDLQMMPEYYVEYSEMIPDILANSQPLKANAHISAQAITRMATAAKAYGRNPDEVHFMPLGSSRGLAMMLVDAKTGQIVGPVAFPRK